MIYPLIGLIAGKAYVNTPVGWGWMEGLTACDKYWCGPDDGPLLTPQNFTRYLRWGEMTPDVGYKTNATVDAVTCYSKDQFYNMEAFNANAPYEWVEYNSRPDPEGKAETVKLMAWLLKTPNRRAPYTADGSPPRIVVQHGVGSNQNNRFTQYVAYTLRSMGFDVLVPGFRNHGWSGKTKHDRTTWGWIYPLDLLGGWDYAVNDPDGKFGGAVDPQKVGVFGVSLGAMTTATAFGMEPKMHAAFIDSGPADPYSELAAQLPSFIPGLIANAILPVVYWGAKWWAGVDIGRYTPEKALLPCAKAPYLRHAGVVASSKDTFVPLSEANKLMDWIGSAGECYVMDEVYLPPADCKGMYHGYETYFNPDVYRVHLCHFFTKALNLTCAYCQLDKLPWYRINQGQQLTYTKTICGGMD